MRQVRVDLRAIPALRIALRIALRARARGAP